MLALRPRPPVLAAIAFFGPPIAAFVLAFALSDLPRESARTAMVVAGAVVVGSDVILPPSKFRDANAWPHGMVIVPPETHDRIAIMIPDPFLSALFGPLTEALLAPGPALL